MNVFPDDIELVEILWEEKEKRIIVYLKNGDVYKLEDKEYPIKL